jgi:hypothetical protein
MSLKSYRPNAQCHHTIAYSYVGRDGQLVEQTTVSYEKDPFDALLSEYKLLQITHMAGFQMRVKKTTRY